MSAMLLADATAPALYIPPRPSWAREDTHRRFWAAVSRAAAREALPDSVFAEFPDDQADGEGQEGDA